MGCMWTEEIREREEKEKKKEEMCFVSLMFVFRSS